MKQKLVVICACLLVLALAGSANAFVWINNITDMYNAGAQDVAIPGSDFDIFNSLADPFGGTIDFSIPFQRLTTGSTWTDWHDGLTIPILFSQSESYARFDFIPNTSGFGFHIESNDHGGPFDLTVGFHDGNLLRQTFTETNGTSGAFIGFLDGDVDYLEISIDPNASGFGVGEMVMTEPIPEPTTMALLGFGILGAGIFRRFRK
jgi:hypothetical protein